MKKIEKEVKVLNVNKQELIHKLETLHAIKIEEGIQKIYIYDIQPINSRFRDCLMQLSNISKEYEFDICRRKMNEIFAELDDLITENEKNILNNNYGEKYFKRIIEKTEDKDLVKVFSDNKIVNIVEKHGLNPNKWIRLRSTNGRATLTVKHLINSEVILENKKTIQKVIENEIDVSSIDECNSLLNQLGYSYRNYQEKERITYKLDGIEVDIDSWPLIPTYAEIEADSEKDISSVIEKLNLQDNEIVSCNTVDIYKKYGLDVYDYRELKF